MCDRREALRRLRSENAELRGLLKEQKSAECKEKESTDASSSGNSSDGQAEPRRSAEALETESDARSELISPAKTLTDESRAELESGSRSGAQRVSRLRVRESGSSTVLHSLGEEFLTDFCVAGWCQVSSPGSCEAERRLR